MPMTRHLRVLLAGATALVACRGSASEGQRGAQSAVQGEASAASSGAAAPSSTTAAGTTCPRTGLWASCSVEKRLAQSGFVVQRSDTEGKPRPGFAVRPTVYMLGKSRLEVFIYPSEAAANSDVAGLDTLAAAPRGSGNPWGMTPTFVRSANLVAVFLTDNPTRGERLSLALGAGAPQP
jgi:hypothetical protein